MTAPVLGSLLEVQPHRATRDLFPRTTQGHGQEIVQSHVPEASQDHVPKIAQKHIVKGIQSHSQGTGPSIIQGHYLVNSPSHLTDVTQGLVLEVRLDHFTNFERDSPGITPTGFEDMDDFQVGEEVVFSGVVGGTGKKDIATKAEIHQSHLVNRSER